jgi:Secretion system C-terminal sorting domain
MKCSASNVTQQATNVTVSTNNCNSEMNWVAFQMPNGINAVSPATNTVITSANGRKYEVRNPNTNPFYSIRFKTQADGITAGKSDVFEYILPPQANPNYLLSQVRLANGETYQAHMSLTSCPVEAAKPAFVDGLGTTALPIDEDEAKLFPNPANDLITITLPEIWLMQSTQLEVVNIAGQVLQRSESPAGQPVFALPLDAALSNGIYFLRLRNAEGLEQSLRFAVQR